MTPDLLNNLLDALAHNLDDLLDSIGKVSQLALQEELYERFDRVYARFGSLRTYLAQEEPK